MKRRFAHIGTPLLLALMIVSLVSLSARLYMDHGFSRAVEAASK